jgi:hypothetical protein
MGMKASAFMLAGLVFVAAAIRATAQQAPAPPAAAVQPSAPAPAPASPRVQQAVTGPKRLGSALPASPSAQSMQRPPPQVHVSVVSPQDSRFAKRLRAGAEEQRVQRARPRSISGMNESMGSRLDSTAPLGMPAE